MCGGLGGGFVFGGEQYVNDILFLFSSKLMLREQKYRIDSIIILNTKSSVRSFCGKGQITFGGNVSLAVGPVGRDIEAHVGASDNKELCAAYSYSQAKGAYIGGTLEGAVLMISNDENKSFYGNPNLTAEMLLDGSFLPPFKAQALGAELAMVVNRKGAYGAIEQTKSMKNLAADGRQLVKTGLSSGSLDLPPDWEEATAPNGSKYYYNSVTGATQWDKPAPVAPAPAPEPVKAAPAPAPVPARPSVPVRPGAVPTATALYDYTASQADELSIATGQKVEIIEKVDANWWKGRVNGKVGLVPATYLQE
jgi:hypothetical protein